MRESFLAREMLTMSNIRLVISIAQKYDNLGVELADLIQVMAQAVLMFS
jgi:RNA polymerase primary sigma factor